MSRPWRKLVPHGVSLKFPQLSFFRETTACEASGLLVAVTESFRETQRSRTSMALSPAVFSLGLMAPATEAQTVINCPNGFTAANGNITPRNPRVGGSIHLMLSQCGWTL
jgi:hypothetical protein